VQQHRHPPVAQCGENGCAGRILAHLRASGVQVFVPTGFAGAPLWSAGFITYAPGGVPSLEMARHADALALHADRVLLLLVAELGGKN
jgi:hypothetical protein